MMNVEPLALRASCLVILGERFDFSLAAVGLFAGNSRFYLCG